MAQITQAQWKKYISRLRQINDKAADEFRQAVAARGGYENIDRQQLIDFAYGLSTKYGEASAALSAQMYDTVAELSGAAVPAALPAETATYSEVAKTVNGVIKKTASDEILAQSIGRLVKRAGADTMLSNAYRDRPKGKGSKKRHSGAQVAWIPWGDTCPFCLTLASKGWVNQTEWGANNHAEHIHANCDCTYAVRFDNSFGVDGYDPDEYKKMYDEAEGSTRDEKINSMRRMQYQDPATRDRINAQKRAAYKNRTKNDFEKQFRLSALSSVDGGNTKRRDLGSVSVDKIPDAIKYFKDQIRNESVEHSIVIQADGNVIHFIGDSEGVSIKGANLKGAHILHNHPISNGLVSFGPDDFVVIRANQSAIYDLCNEKYDYHLEVLQNISKLSYNEAKDMTQVSVAELLAGEDYQHSVMQALNDKGYIKYERRKKEGN